MRIDTTLHSLGPASRIVFVIFWFVVLLHSGAAGQRLPLSKPNQTPSILREVEQRFAPDPHMAIFRISIETNGDTLILAGKVDKPEAKSAALEAIHRIGAKMVDHIL